MAVDSQHPEYKKLCKRWDLVRSVTRNDAEHWIRVVDPNDPTRSRQYRQDAILTNFTRLTKEGLTGLVFRKDSSKDLPEALQYLEVDATGYKFGLDQLAQKVVGEILETGRYGLLVDYPQGNPGFAKIRPYNAESIINWKYTDVGSEYKLSLIVLKEEVDELGEDGFEWVCKCQYRVLFLNAEGYYTQVIYNQDLEIMTNTMVMPVDYSGSPLTNIPFTFVGSENNDAWIDAIPLYDIAIINLGHYRNSADLEETSFIAGQLVPVINPGESGEEQFKEANPNGILIGSRKGIVVGPGGDFKFVQGSPNVIPREIMKDKESQAAALGARLISPPGGRETAEAARIRYGSQNSVLYTITRNISSAIEQSLWYAAIFMMETPEPSIYRLNDQFYEENADPNLIAQEIMLLNSGVINKDEVRENLKRTGLKLDDNFNPNTLEGIDSEISSEEDNY